MLKGAGVLSTSINATVADITINGDGDTAAVGDTVEIDLEQMLVTAVANQRNFTATRGVNGTSASSHTGNSLVRFSAEAVSGGGWEYKLDIFEVAKGAPYLESRLNEIGLQGWELIVFCTFDYHNATTVYKRQISQPAT
jgi:hypothetical protein